MNKVPFILRPLLHAISSLVERGRNGEGISLGCFEGDLGVVSRGSCDRGQC